MKSPADYWNYHGHEYPWIGWEELTNWASGDCYEAMKACNRSAHPGMPRKYRSNTNPYGVGHNWVKAYFIDAAAGGVPVGDSRKRVHIKGYWWENPSLLENDPEYIDNIRSDSNTERRKAWYDGNWDITSGGMFDDLWDARVHVLEPFPIPDSWRIDRAFDWGSAHPFSVGWWAESDGTTAPNGRTYPRGTLFRIGEWYGWNGRPNEGNRMLAGEIARGIKEREKAEGWAVKKGPADTNIFDAEHGVTLADDMAKLGVHWEKADKGPGTRRIGWERMRGMLEAARNADLEEPGLYVFDTCVQFVRTVPPLPRSERDPDDADTNAEDHIADETRYRIMTKKKTLRIGTYYG
jgi:hypothetical protein